MANSPEAHERRREMERRFAANAATYREHWAPPLRRATRRLLCELPIKRPRRSLDVGTGVGSLLPDLKRASAEAGLVVGVDFVEGMLVNAPRTYPLAIMDGLHLGFTPASFDLILMAFMLQLFKQPVEALKQAREALASRGVVATATWGSSSDWPAQRIWDEELDAHGAAPADTSFTSHDQLDHPHKLCELLLEAGCTSPRSWVVSLDAPFSLEAFLAIKQNLGRSSRRFGSLEQDARSSLLERTRNRLAELDDDGLIDRSQVILSFARSE